MQRRPIFSDLPIAVLTASWWMRMVALLPVIAALWVAIWWAMAMD